MFVQHIENLNYSQLKQTYSYMNNKLGADYVRCQVSDLVIPCRMQLGMERGVMGRTIKVDGLWGGGSAG